MFRPRTEEELAAAVGEARSVRVFGNKQSSADIAAGTETLIDMSEYNRIVESDPARRRITVEAGMTLKALMDHVEARGWTFSCLPDIDTVTVGGALSTGTHGTTGSAHPLAESMVAARLITADGTVREIDESSELMPALR
ncbi:MAG: FAD-binding protein, partial [Spirochaetes bacterium]|nr:FAD-binding protein [Spirochaetota bacterium]